jgi:hypothetical protein
VKTQANNDNHHSYQWQPEMVNVPVWVQCKGYRCMAVLNYKGEWRAYPSHKPLEDVIKVLGENPMFDV